MTTAATPDSTNTTVLVTGATRGLGLAIAERLHDDGMRVVATGRTETDGLKALVARSQGRVSFSPFDMADVDGIHGFCAALRDEVGLIHCLVNNAAVGNDGVLATMHNSDIAGTVHVNVVAPIVLTKYLVRQMISKRCRGRVVNVSSIIASTGYSGLSVYAATKAAMVGFTKSLAREVGRAGITVNAVAPGYMRTEMTSGIGTSSLESIQRRSAMRTLINVNDAAAAVAYLLGPDGARVTGSVMTVDAGSTA